MMRQERRERRTAELIRPDKERDNQMVDAAIERSKSLDTTIRGKYSIWRRDYENPNSDSTVKLMRDQIIMAKAYATIAKSKNDNVLYNSLMKHSRESQKVIGEAKSDADLGPRYCYLLLLLFLFIMLKLIASDITNGFLCVLPVLLIKRKPWVTCFLWQRINCMIAL